SSPAPRPSRIPPVGGAAAVPTPRSPVGRWWCSPADGSSRGGLRHPRLDSATVTSAPAAIRLTQYAHGGGCACKIPPGELESIVAGLAGGEQGDLLVGLDDGDDAAVVRLDGDRAIVATVDFFTPVLDDAYDWGRVAAANALSDVYAMGGTPLVAATFLAGPRAVLPWSLSTGVWRGGPAVAREAAGRVAAGH